MKLKNKFDFNLWSVLVKRSFGFFLSFFVYLYMKEFCFYYIKRFVKLKMFLE